MVIRKEKASNGHEVIFFKENKKYDYIINYALCLIEDCNRIIPINKNKERGGKKK